MMARYREYLQWCSAQGMMETHPSAVLSFEDYSARIIQSWWRRLAEPTEVRGAQVHVTRPSLLYIMKKKLEILIFTFSEVDYCH